MAVQKSLCQDCKYPRAECICTDRCDFCGNKEKQCHCGLDHDPLGNVPATHSDWRREMENERNLLDAWEDKDIQEESLRYAEEFFALQAEVVREED